MNVIGFYSAGAAYGCFSNWYKCKFTLEGIEYTSTEQAMMYYKAMLFGDDIVARKILSTNNPSQIKAYGRQVRNFNEAVWKSNRETIMFNCLLAKFSQNPEIAKVLLGANVHRQTAYGVLALL